MHFLRLLRIFIPLLLVAAIVAGGVVVFTSRSDLQTARRRVDDTWKPLRTALDTRYGALATADNVVRSTPGPLHQIVVQIDREYADWRNLEANGAGVASQVTAANALESLGRRLVLAARAAPRLVGNVPALGSVDVYASLAPPTALAAPFQAAVSHYERERNRPARRLAAGILGYKSVPAYDASGSP
jgi:hypothetical protein